MDLIVSRGERQEEVRLERDADGLWRVEVGERSYLVDVATAGDLLSLRLAADAEIAGEGGDEDDAGAARAKTRAGRQFEVAVRRVSSRGASVYQVSSRRGAESVTVTDPLTHLMQQSRPGGGGGGVALAMMPGRVVEVLVAAGEEVEAGQGVVVLEAMKMKNEIQAETAGVVKTIHVDAGQNVDAGDPLFEVA